MYDLMVIFDIFSFWISIIYNLLSPIFAICKLFVSDITQRTNVVPILYNEGLCEPSILILEFARFNARTK